MAHGRQSRRGDSGAAPAGDHRRRRPVMNPVPALGEHADAILRELGRTDAEIASLRVGRTV
jgi:itaconate CoA-transferase